MSSGQEMTIVDNEVYNLITTTATTLEGLAAYNKYQQDGQANDPLWPTLRQQDEGGSIPWWCWCSGDM